jgi:hypothetical protein
MALCLKPVLEVVTWQLYELVSMSAIVTLNNPAILFYHKVLAGDVEPAVRTHKAFYTVWKRYGFTPEGFNLATSSVQVR